MFVPILGRGRCGVCGAVAVATAVAAVLALMCARPAPAAAVASIWTCYNQQAMEYCWGGSDNRHDFVLDKIQNQSGKSAYICMKIEEFGGSHVGTEHSLCPTTLVAPDGTDTWNFGTAYSSGWPLGAAGAQSMFANPSGGAGNNFWNYWTT